MHARIRRSGYARIFVWNLLITHCSQKYHNGITFERVKAIMMARLSHNK